MRHILSLFLALLIALLPIAALAEAQDDSAIRRAYADFVEQTLESDGTLKYHRYDEDPDYPYFSLAFESNDGRLGDVYCALITYSSGVLVQSFYEDDVDLAYMDEIAKFFNLVNADLLGGKYYLLPNSGSIVYEVHFFMDVDNLGAYESEHLMTLLDSAVAEVDYDADYIMAILGGESAENAYAMYTADLNSDD